MSSGLATRYAPSFRLIEAHFGLGLLGLLAFSTALLVRAAEVQGFFFQPLLLGLVHLCVLGWLMPVAMGALHQLVPVVFEVPVRSERLAWGAFGLYALAVPLFIARMWTLSADWLLAAAAVGAAAAIWLYVANLYATLLRSGQRSLTGTYVTAALGWLLFAVTLGALLAVNLYRPFLPLFHLSVLRAHAHAAAFGFFGLLIMGGA
jgi:cbb3-type cytochrome oxidase subunit 1